MASNEGTLYERLGGRDQVDRIVIGMYARIATNAKLVPFFRDVEMDRQMTKLTDFVSYAFGGPGSNRDLRQAHHHLVERGLHDKHFDLVAACFAAAMREAMIDERLIAEALAVVEGVRDEVLGR
jgi:truncated hemoglobin YjbI